MFPWERKKLLTERMKLIVIFRKRNFRCAEIGEMFGVKVETIFQQSMKAKKRAGCKKITDIKLTSEDLTKYLPIAEQMMKEWLQKQF